MEIGHQIKNLRARRGVTQETLASAIGVTAQAVSKWETGTASPDIGLLPALSVYFGVTIDALFALSDDSRMERIQNMIWDVRVLNPVDVENSREFLLEKSKKEPKNGKVLELLADLENRLAEDHHKLAEDYAKEALERDPKLRGARSILVEAMHGKCGDWAGGDHHLLIQWLRDYLERHPGDSFTAMWLMDQLIDGYRFAEAEEVFADMETYDSSYRVAMYRGMLDWHQGRKEQAYAVWQTRMEQQPDEWVLPATIGEHLCRDGRYREAIPYFRRAFEVAKAPRFSDPLICLTQCYELMGDKPAAAAVCREHLALLQNEWGCKAGDETYDYVQRKLDRLLG